jgi:WD40 repeat protein
MLSIGLQTLARLCVRAVIRLNAGQDGQTLLWDISQAKEKQITNHLAYYSTGQVNNLSWNCSNPEYIAIATNDGIEGLHL